MSKCSAHLPNTALKVFSRESSGIVCPGNETRSYSQLDLQALANMRHGDIDVSVGTTAALQGSAVLFRRKASAGEISRLVARMPLNWVTSGRASSCLASSITPRPSGRRPFDETGSAVSRCSDYNAKRLVQGTFRLQNRCKGRPDREP